MKEIVELAFFERPMVDYKISPIGVVHSCFKEKFGVPRQSGLIMAAQGVIEIYSEYSRVEAVRGLEQFSHLWLLFIFHHALNKQWRPTVRPPRLGGNQRIGVFSTRSPFRPNSIGMSVVALDQVEVVDKNILLHVSGLDLVEGTPVIDIKPYLSYVDAIPNARGGFAAQRPQESLRVAFTQKALEQCEEKLKAHPKLQVLISQLLALDPCPAYINKQDKIYGMRLYDFDLKWQVTQEGILVTELSPVN